MCVYVEGGSGLLLSLLFLFVFSDDHVMRTFFVHHQQLNSKFAYFHKTNSSVCARPRVCEGMCVGMSAIQYVAAG